MKNATFLVLNPQGFAHAEFSRLIFCCASTTLLFILLGLTSSGTYQTCMLTSFTSLSIYALITPSVEKQPPPSVSYFDFVPAPIMICHHLFVSIFCCPHGNTNSAMLGCICCLLVHFLYTEGCLEHVLHRCEKNPHS